MLPNGPKFLCGLTKKRSVLLFDCIPRRHSERVFMRIVIPRCARRALCFAALATLSIAASAVAEDVTIHRDDFGIPHIFAATAEGACYGMGYAQAEDRLEELLKQYLRATGRMSEAFGPGNFRDDYRQRLWRHAAISKEKYPVISATS